MRLSGAVISEDGRFRTRLWRIWDPELPRVLWLMLNPSTAGPVEDDATVLKTVAFTKRWGRFGGIEIGNLYAYRTVSPGLLKFAHYPVGPGNDEVLRALMVSVVVEGLGCAVAAWGTHAQPNRALDVRTDAELLGVPLYHLGLNKGGSPKHPLYLPLDTEPQEWVL